MSMIITANIHHIESRRGTSKKTGRPYTAYTAHTSEGIQLDCGFSSPAFNEGDTVNVEVEDGYRAGTFKVLRVTDKAATTSTPTGATPAAPSVRPTPTAPAGRTFPLHPTSPEMSIVRQSALKAAIDTVAVHDKVYKDVEELSDVIIDLAYKYVDFSSGLREVKLADESTKKPVKRRTKAVVDDPDEDHIDGR